MNQNIQKEYHISQDGSGDFRSLFEALSALQSSEFPEEANQAENLPAAPDFRSSGGDTEPVVLFLHAGIYRERIVILRPGITIIGDDPQTTVITGGLYARMPMENAELSAPTPASLQLTTSPLKMLPLKTALE